MVAFLSDNVLDNGLQYLTDNGLRVDVCSQKPSDYTEATSTYTLGNKTNPTVGSPTNGASNGRRVIVSAITDGSVTSTGTATHWALSSASELLATQELTSSVAVVTGSTFTLDAISVTFPDPTT